MKKLKIFTTILTSMLLLTACGSSVGVPKNDFVTDDNSVEINLSDEGITVDQNQLVPMKKMPFIPQMTLYTTNPARILLTAKVPKKMPIALKRQQPTQ